MKVSIGTRWCLLMAMSSLTLLTWNMCLNTADDKEQPKLPRESLHTPHRLLEVLKGHTGIPHLYTHTQPRRPTGQGFGRYTAQTQRLSDIVRKYTLTGKKLAETSRGEAMRYTQRLKKQRLVHKYPKVFPKRSTTAKQRESGVSFSPPPFNNHSKKQQSSSQKIQTQRISASHASGIFLDNKNIPHNTAQNHNTFPERKANTIPAISVPTQNVFTENGEEKGNRRQFAERRPSLSEENKNVEHANASVETQPDFRSAGASQQRHQEDSSDNKHGSRTGRDSAFQEPDEQDHHLILVHESPWYVHSPDVDFSSCEYSQCRLSYNRSLLATARAVVFDAVNLHQNPPQPRPPDQLWVLFLMEPPSRLRDQNPHFQGSGWKTVFNLTMSYRWDSDIFCPYGFVLLKDTTAKEHQSLYRKAASFMKNSWFEKQGGNKSLDYNHSSISFKRKSSRQANGRLGKTMLYPDHDESLPRWGHFTEPHYNSRAQEGTASRNLTQTEKRHAHKSPKFKTVRQDKLPAESSRGREGSRAENTGHPHKATSSADPPITAPLPPSTPRPQFLHVAASKTRSAIWVVSHCQAESARDQYVRRLQRHLDVDVYGKCSGRRCGNDAECGRLINSTYRFLLALENSFCRDYITEKVFNTYSDIYVIPVVRGGAEYSRILPRGTYVDTNDFPSPEALATFLIGLSRDHVTYARMLERKMMQQAVQWRWAWPFPWCQLCRLLQDSASWTAGSRAYADTADWISGRQVCWPPPDLPSFSHQHNTDQPPEL